MLIILHVFAQRFKPFLAAASVKAGAVDAAKFAKNELALMCASHSGE